MPSTVPVPRVLAPGVVVVDDLLDAAECAAFIAFADAHGYEDAPITTGRGFQMRKDIRNNDRAMVDDAARAGLLWSRVAPFCFDVGGRRAVGWQFVRLRTPGQIFLPPSAASYPILFP